MADWLLHGVHGNIPASAVYTPSQPNRPCNCQEIATSGQFYYCKSGNIRGTLIFAYFAQIQQARIQKPAKIFAIFCMHILDA